MCSENSLFLLFISRSLFFFSLNSLRSQISMFLYSTVLCKNKEYLNLSINDFNKRFVHNLLSVSLCLSFSLSLNHIHVHIHAHKRTVFSPINKHTHMRVLVIFFHRMLLYFAVRKCTKR